MTANKYPRHDFWGAGEADCPRDLKARNGELCDMRCKVCGDGWRESQDVCMVALGHDDDARDAAKWRALIGSARIRPLGCAGLLPGNGPDSTYGHLGLELWTRHAPLDSTDTEHARGVEWLELYVRQAQRTQAAESSAGNAGVPLVDGETK